MNTDETLSSSFDIAIVGGGMVGAALACVLPAELSVVMLEQFPLPKNAQIDEALLQPSFDNRATALSRSTQHAFEGIGLWQDISAYAEKIKDVHVSDQGFWGSVLMQNQQESFDVLGYVIENRALGHLIFSAVSKRDSVQVISPAQVDSITITGSGAELDYRVAQPESGSDNADAVKKLSAGLVIVADGANSSCCERLGIRKTVTDYGHSAIVANVATSQAHRGVAYERFTSTGPMALLPLLPLPQSPSNPSPYRSALVWTLPSQDAEEIMQQDDESFLALLQERFGFYQGDFVQVGKRNSYPLALSQTTEQVRNHVVVMGNAAHSLHPVAGQGFNLALRDVMLLSKTIEQALVNDEAWNKLAVLESYVHSQQLDQWLTTQFSDFLPQIFSENASLIKLSRNLGLLALELLPSIKTPLVRFATGYR